VAPRAISSTGGCLVGLDTVELVMAVEEIFEIEIREDTAQTLITVGDLHQFVVDELIRLGRPSVNSEIVFEQLRRVICDELGVSSEDVIPRARFVQDLGAA
jgi:acyl carrier protein